MKKPSPALNDDPIGIVISRGSRDEPKPLFSAYVWGSLPDPADQTSKAA